MEKKIKNRNDGTNFSNPICDSDGTASETRSIV
jgi:hypothetical protein